MARVAVDNVEFVELQAPARPEKNKSPRPAVLSGAFSPLGTRLDRMSRPRFGRSISLDRIEIALRASFAGYMRNLTDLSRETVDTDPHLASVLNKRFRALASLPWEVHPATGPGVALDKALYYADVAREQLKAMAGFRRLLLWMAWGLFDGRACSELQWGQVQSGTGITSKQFGNPVMYLDRAWWVHPRRLSFGNYRELLIQDDTYSSETFPRTGLDVATMPYKFVYWMPQLFGEYPEREGLAPRTMYWSFFKRFAARERMILTELFGKPWRVLEVDEESSASEDDLLDADDLLETLGSSYTVRLPRGTKLNVVQPQRTAGQVHSEIIKEADQQNSKLVLGQTGTTDGTTAGFNSNQAGVMQDEQTMLLQADALLLNEVIEDCLTDAIIAVNFGPEEVTHAPTFVLRGDLPANRVQEIARLDGALKAGLSIARNEAYEVAGFKVPNETDVVIQIAQPPAQPNSPVAPAPRPMLLYPQDTSPPVAEQQPIPLIAGTAEGGSPASAAVGAADAAKTIKVNEDRAARGLGPLTRPDGSLDPDGELTIMEFESLRSYTTRISEAVTPTAPADEQKNIQQAIQARVRKKGSKWVAESEDGSKSFGEYDSKAEAEKRIRQVEYFKHQATAPHPSVNRLLLRGDSSSLPIGLAIDLVQATYENDLLVSGIARMVSSGCCEEHEHGVRCANWMRQPDGAFGNVETILDRSVSETRATVRSMVNAYKRAVDGLGAPVAIFAALQHARNAMDVRPMGRLLERRMVQSVGLGALDSAHDGGMLKEKIQAATIGVIVEVAKFAIGDRVESLVDHMPGMKGMQGTVEIVREGDPAYYGVKFDGEDEVHKWLAEDELKRVGDAATVKMAAPAQSFADYAKMPFDRAMRYVRDKQVVQRATFDRLSAQAKRRSFTVAGVLSDRMLGTLQDELAKQVGQGTDLNDFQDHIEDRMKDAGFLATLQPVEEGGAAVLTASHVETVFRTNVLGAYNAGRAAQMSEPTTLEKRPVWEVRGVDDHGTRPSHKSAHGMMILASDPVWQSAYPPFGFSCRCRVISRGADYVSQAVAGSELASLGLPDEGFVSGLPNLLD